MSNVWRLQTNTDSKTGERIAQYCLDHNVLAMGWSLKREDLAYYINKGNMPPDGFRRDEIRSDMGKYEAIVAQTGIYGGWVDSNVKRMCSEIKPDDLVWIRDGGKYYLGRVTEKSHWVFEGSQTAEYLDAANQVTDIEWHEIGDESDVPGAISTSLIRGRTLQKIWKEGALAFSQLIYNEKANKSHYKGVALENTCDVFYSLLSPDDCEDLLCMWLYANRGYICIPSTNKKSTPLYECVLIDPDTGRHIYPQVKAGEVTIDANDYAGLDGEVWLFTTKGQVINLPCSPQSHIFSAEPKALFEFAQSDLGRRILPQSIVKWRAKLLSV